MPVTMLVFGHLTLLSANAFNLDLAKMLLFGKLLTISLATNIRLLQTERSLQMTISCLMKMAESSQNGKKTLREKEKLLITSNFSFSNSVFKRPFLQTRENQGLFGKGLSNSYVTFPNPRLSNSSGSFFLDPEKKKPTKTMLEREKILDTRISIHQTFF